MPRQEHKSLRIESAAASSEQPSGLSRLLEQPWFTVLFAAFPAVSLYAANLDQIVLVDTIRAVLFSEMLLGFLFAASFPILRDVRSAGALAGLSILAFFSYGPVYSVVKAASLFGLIIGRHRYLLLLWILMLVAALVMLVRHRFSKRAARLANLLALLLVAMPLTTAISRIGGITLTRNIDSQSADGVTDSQANRILSELPDIYYIIADSYVRSDILLEDFGESNSDFIEFLAAQGFYVADESNANYLWTHQSLASSLNMAYLDDLLGGEEPGRRIRADEHIKHGLVRRELEALGYRTIAFPTGWVGTELFDADILLTPNMSRADELRARDALNEFEGQLLYQTAIRALLDLDQAGRTPAAGFIEDRMTRRFDVQREIVLGAFENLKTVPNIPGPKFVFAHIISPHRPYLFGPSGEPLDQSGPFTLSIDAELPVDVERGYYRDQLIFVTRMLQETIQQIIESSSRPLVIIVQGDHGFSPELDWENVELPALIARMGILNAYYLSAPCREGLYSTVTPVNTFRHVFSCELGLEYPLLEDVTYIGYDSFTPLSEVVPILGTEP